MVLGRNPVFIGKLRVVYIVFFGRYFHCEAPISLSDFQVAVFCCYSASIYPVSTFYLFLNKNRISFI